MNKHFTASGLIYAKCSSNIIYAMIPSDYQDLHRYMMNLPSNEYEDIRHHDIISHHCISYLSFNRKHIDKCYIAVSQKILAYPLD